MKSFLGLIVCAFSLLAFASTAHSNGEANGDFDFSLSGATGTVIFAGGINNAGVVNGGMTFTATVDVANPSGEGDPVQLDVAIGLNFDCMVVSGNRAAMSGTITSSDVPGYVGQQALLVVADRVEGVSPPTDAFGWGVYAPRVVNFNAADDELYPCTLPETFPDDPPVCPTLDPGRLRTWTSADAELYPCTLPPGYPEDPPVCPTPDPSGFTTGIPVTPTAISCDSFPLSSYPLSLIPNGGGNKVLVKTGT